MWSPYTRGFPPIVTVSFPSHAECEKSRVLSDVEWAVSGVLEVTHARYVPRIPAVFCRIVYAETALLLLTQMQLSREETLLAVLRLFSSTPAGDLSSGGIDKGVSCRGKSAVSRGSVFGGKTGHVDAGIPGDLFGVTEPSGASASRDDAVIRGISRPRGFRSFGVGG